MKIKADFVTNSSSNCYIILDSSNLGRQNDIETLIFGLAEAMEYCDSSYIEETFSSMKDLDEYTNNGPLDWVQKATGPRFWNMSEDFYNDCKKVIIQNIPDLCKHIHLVHFDRNHDIEKEINELPDVSVVKIYYW